MSRLTFSSWLPAFVVTLAACTSPSTPPSGVRPGVTASVAAPSTRVPGVHLPRGVVHPLDVTQISYQGGSIIPNVHVIPVFWTSNVNRIVQREIHCFYSAVVNSTYMDWLSEYNTPTQSIGRGSVGNDITIAPHNTSSLLTDDDVHDELSFQIDSGFLPPPDGSNTLYAIYFPPGVEIDFKSTASRSCVDWCAYHYSYSHNGQGVRYMVVPDSQDGKIGGGCKCSGGDPFNSISTSSSHEMVEAITDPDPFTSWAIPGGGDETEIGDLNGCDGTRQLLPGTQYDVQPIWSTTRQSCFAPTSGSPPTELPQIDDVTPTTIPFDSTTTEAVVTGACFANPIAWVSMLGASDAPAIVKESTYRTMTLTMPRSPSGTEGNASLRLFNSTNPGPVTFQPLTYVYSGAISFSPASGPMQGGTAVTIQGPAFPPGFNTIDVRFGSVPATSVQCTATSCVAYTPANGPGSAPVELTIGGVHQKAGAPFTYQGPQITSISPSSGPITGGTTLTISGINMTGTSVSSFTAAARMNGNVSLGDASCVRTGLYDGLCQLVTPTLTGLPTPNPADIQLVVPHINGSHVPTAITPSDQYSFTTSPAVTQLSFAGLEVGGATVVGTIQLNGKMAAKTSIDLALSQGSPSGVVSFDSSASIDAGQTSTSFKVTILNQNFTGDIKIVATYLTSHTTGTLTISPTPAPVFAPIGSLCAGQTSTGILKLFEPAPKGGGVVHFDSSNSAAMVSPADVKVSEGATQVSFNLVAAAPVAPQTVQLNANYFGVAATPISFQVLPTAALSLSLPDSIDASHSVKGTVQLCAPAPGGGTKVDLSSSNSIITVDSSATITQGNTSASFTASAGFTTQSFLGATIKATAPAATASKWVLVNPGCPAGQFRCTCSDGAQTCVKTPPQCPVFCRSN